MCYGKGILQPGKGKPRCPTSLGLRAAKETQEACVGGAERKHRREKRKRKQFLTPRDWEGTPPLQSQRRPALVSTATRIDHVCVAASMSLQVFFSLGELSLHAATGRACTVPILVPKKLLFVFHLLTYDVNTF